MVVLISVDEKEEIREIKEANFIETCLIVNSTKYLKCQFIKPDPDGEV